MKKLITFSLLLFTFSFVFADAKDPAAPFDVYEPAMSSTEKDPLTVNWQDAHAAELKAAVKDDVLAGFVKDEAAASALLAKVGPAYKTCPIAAHQIGAVSQWVMVDDDVAWYDFWSDTPRADGRKVWVKALVSRIESSNDAYVQLFCLDQLRWCGCACPCIRARLVEIGNKSTDRHVQEMVAIVLKTLE